MFARNEKKKIISVKNFSDKLIKGSTNYQKSTIGDHAKTAQNLKSLKLEEKRNFHVRRYKISNT